MGWLTKRAERFLVVLMLFLISLSFVLPSLSYAQSNASQSDRITVDFVNADLVQVVRILNDKAKHNIIIADPEIGQKKVTATLTDVPLETALEKIVRSAGCSWKQEDGVYIISNVNDPSTDSLAPTVNTVNSAAPLVDDFGSVSPKPADTLVARKDKRVETIKLYNVHPKDMMRILGLHEEDSYSSWSSRGYHKNPDGSITPGWGASTPTPPMSDLLRSDPTVAQRAPSPIDEFGQYQPAPGYGGTAPGVRPPTVTTPTTTPGTRPGTTTTGTTGTTTTGTSTQRSGLLPEGIDFIMPYETDNSLIVRGDEEGISELKSIISLLDVAPKQIWIEARFVSISTSELDSLGINWDVSRMNTSFQTNFQSSR
jgi:type II secretory pathway component GspD/PulD (secretin)